MKANSSFGEVDRRHKVWPYLEIQMKLDWNAPFQSLTWVGGVP